MENKNAVLEVIDEEREQNLSAFQHSPGPWAIEHNSDMTVTLKDVNGKVIAVICTGSPDGSGHVGTTAECKGNIAIIAAALEAAVMYEQAGLSAEICASMISSMETMASLG
ncbi:MAG TPA: hypothetical protein ENH94_07555 [Phycisphaerales bacterium]|nr:hypothetical protein [Phycisphaerales bacterium]